MQIRNTKSGTKCQLSQVMGCGAARLVSSGRAINGRTYPFKTPTPLSLISSLGCQAQCVKV